MYGLKQRSIYGLEACRRALARAILAISPGFCESFWATNEKSTHELKNPSRLKNAFREYIRSSSSVLNDAKIRRMLAKIMESG